MVASFPGPTQFFNVARCFCNIEKLGRHRVRGCKPCKNLEHVYIRMQNLERYLEKTFKDQTFLPISKLFDSIESEINLQMPTATKTPGYKVMTYMESQV